MNLVKHENLIAIGGVVGGLGVSLINYKPEEMGIGIDFDPLYSKIGLPISVGSLAFLISERAKQTTKHSLMIGAALGTAMLGYLIYLDNKNPKVDLSSSKEKTGTGIVPTRNAPIVTGG
jgi:hypothetical protein